MKRFLDFVIKFFLKEKALKDFKFETFVKMCCTAIEKLVFEG
jgi:hypothetical protein